MIKKKITFILTVSIMLSLALVSMAAKAPKIVITKAVYGLKDNKSKQVDLTEKLQKQVEKGDLKLSANNKIAGKDPAYGSIKSLYIEYTINGRKMEKSIPENAVFNTATGKIISGGNVRRRRRGGRSGGVGHLPSVGAERPLSAETEKSLLETDWLFQANGNPTADLVRKEVGWARDLAERISKMKGAPSLKKPLGILKTLEGSIEGAEDIKELYFKVRRVKRDIMFMNPKIDFDEILLVDSPYPRMLHGHSGHESGHRNGSQQTNGGSKLQIIKGLRPGAEVLNLLPEGTDAYVWRPDLSYDARKLLFCKKDVTGPSFQIFEVNVDGTGMKQLTKSKFDDLDPIYLPDGKIMFSTTRAHTYVRCLPTSAAFVIARCDADGKNIRIISRNSEPDFLPALLPNGSVVYTRWEYTERPLWRLQGLWSMNPDGTTVQVFWGNRSEHPDMLIEPRPIPDSNRVMFIGAGHHKFFAGCLGIVDINKGREYPNGLTKITPDVRWPEVGDHRTIKTPTESAKYHSSGRFAAYKSPYPIGPEDFLVSARSGPEGGGNRVSHNEVFSLYLMDLHGNRELIYRGDNNVWYAMPVKARKRPAVRPDLVKWPKKGEKAVGGTMYSADVYEGVEGLERGSVKYLRVFQMDAKTYTAMNKTWRHSGPAVSIIQEDGVKRILGTVPVEKDGSVHFKVPSGVALHFQLLDENYRCLQIMRSFTGVMPGERRGCFGCHEQNNKAPASFTRKTIAMKRKPSDLTEPPWGAAASISYERFCQPILDKYCGECHQGDKNPKARKRLDLTLRGGVKEKGISDPKLFPFKEPYCTLIGQAWLGPKIKGPGAGIAGPMMVEGHNRSYGIQGEGGLKPIKPMSVLSYTSPLINMVMSGKHPKASDGSEVKAKIKIEGDDLRRLIAWVDANCVYRGDEEIRMIPDPSANKFARFAVKPLIKSAPVIDRLQPVTDVID